MHSARTAVAGGMVLLCIMLIYEKKYVKALLSFFVALSFHNLSIGVLFLALTMLPITLLCILFSFVTLFIIAYNPMMLIAKLLSVIGLGGISNKVVSYSNSLDSGHAFQLYDPRSILVILIIFLLFKNIKHLNKPIDIFLGKVFIIGGIVMYFFSPIVIISWRVSFLFLSCAVLLIPRLCYTYNLQFYRQIGVKRVMTSFFIFIYLLWNSALIFKAQEYSFILWPSTSVN
jgi:hypothetical protein